MFPLNYILFLQIVIFLFITPGTPRIVIISHSMNYGVRNCIWTALGDVSANIIQATLVIFVLGSFFLDNPNFLNTLKWFGVLYLFYLSYDVYKTKPKNPDGKTRCWTGGNADILAQAWAKGGESGLEKAHDKLKQKFAKFKK